MRNGIVIAPDAGNFLDQHSLSAALDVIDETVRETYQYLEQITVELQEDPEVPDFECLVVTLRVRGSTAQILESERKARSLLRRRLPEEAYRIFAVVYERPT